MKNNLLYLVTKLELGGAQKHVLDLVRSADRGRFNVFLFSAREGLLWPEAERLPGLEEPPTTAAPRTTTGPFKIRY